MKIFKGKPEKIKKKERYEKPLVSSLILHLEYHIAAGSTVQGTTMQQEHNEETKSQNVEW
ncbi:hypothetical protein [Sphingobacterium gobiense]|uniref:Uncharacterized protein n=1 Tax=Sphingobacterium gobiense TaxID=1382456 RepID=A0A2S9JU98_9SPHI|nr:hypothetical protein [Sphingobacterium gobiense]PRD56818.1 hypothetical protein C5749_06230 [Sphingobacterium gobiense]